MHSTELKRQFIGVINLLISYIFLDLTSCKNDSECDHSNCHYCTSAGYCRSYGIRKYCDVYDCGIGDGSCFSYDGVSYCKSNLTCKRNRFLDYHPLLAKCLRDDVSNNKPKYYTACVSKGI